ncbi:MAG: BrnT family toxin [Deltaproteobacteria bacterium]|nr:BrnT family toxin [Deltaproteobacteria bacterium]
MSEINSIAEFEGFDWDEANIQKNWIKHKVTPTECEQLFFNKPLLIADDEKHSKMEKRYYALGHTNENRYLFIAFTARNNLIRVISARNMNQKERRIYTNL